MTGPEHYAAAEQALAGVTGEMHPAQVGALISSAAVHAQLAQVAATVETFGLAGPYGRGQVAEDSGRAWRDVLGLGGAP